MYRPFLFLLFSLSASAFLWGQQQTPLTLAEAEAQFQSKNLMLIAERFNVDLAEAEIVQARLFQDPVISFEQNIYNRTNGKYFDIGREGEQIVEIEQLISIAGQRNNRIRLEKINRDIARYAFEELLLTQRSQLREKFISLYYAERSLQIYDSEIESIGQLLEYYKSEAQKGNISLFEKARLEAMRLHLRMEKNEREDDALTLRCEQAFSQLLLAVEQLKKAINLYQNANHQLEYDFQQIMGGINENFRKRNINLIEFIDYYQTYKDNGLQLFDLRKNLLLAAEGLNLAAGHDIISFAHITNP